MLSKELTEMHERLAERDDEICELKAERNNTRVKSSRNVVTGGSVTWGEPQHSAPRPI